MADVRTYSYDGEANTASRERMLIGWDAFFRQTDRNLFKVTVREDESTSIIASDGECMDLKDVTPEQIVILFATVRGLKEAARE